MPVGEIRVQGLRELQIAFSETSAEMKKALRAELREVAEPVRVGAESLAMKEISHLGPGWSRMRIGTTLNTVYVAPKSHRQGGSPRPNLAGLLMDKAMQPALEEAEPEILAGLTLMLDRVSVGHGF